MNWDDEHPGYRVELGRRIAHALERAGTKKVVAERAGISVEQLNKWTSEDPPKVPVSGLLAVAAATGADFVWLATGREASADSLQPQSVASGPDIPRIPRYSVTLSAGHGSFLDRAEQLGSVPFTVEFLAQRLGRKPENLAIVNARGDSMEPTIADGDQVMIDTADTQLAPAIWAFTLDDALLVKRLSPTPQGVQAMSDNPAYSPFTISRADAASFHLIGRVVWVGRVF